MSHKMPPTRQLVIPLCIEGRLTISIIDSLIIVHNLTEHVCYILKIYLIHDYEINIEINMQ